jgi:hypothetical protein
MEDMGAAKGWLDRFEAQPCYHEGNRIEQQSLYRNAHGVDPIVADQFALGLATERALPSNV